MNYKIGFYYTDIESDTKLSELEFSWVELPPSDEIIQQIKEKLGLDTIVGITTIERLGFKSLYTFGYSGYEPGDLAALVDNYGAYVADIRLSPYSQLPGWRKDSLKELLNKNFTQYIWVEDLGNLNNRQVGSEVQIKNLPAGTKKILDGLLHRPVILLCGCAFVHSCHRSYVAAHIARLAEHDSYTELYPLNKVIKLDPPVRTRRLTDFDSLHKNKWPPNEVNND